ncbi:hypothetical protein [Bradyrhizobium sp.]|uniref:hypothetical protein n=1 Tax=Bradyrhizobium sp. TaxID=376 RepID=UPI003C709AFE
MAKTAYEIITITNPDEAFGIAGRPYAVKVRDPRFPELTVLGFSSEAEADRWIASQRSVTGSRDA